jgi:hypothetical protein
MEGLPSVIYVLIRWENTMQVQHIEDGRPALCYLWVDHVGEYYASTANI